MIIFVKHWIPVDTRALGKGHNWTRQELWRASWRVWTLSSAHRWNQCSLHTARQTSNRVCYRSFAKRSSWRWLLRFQCVNLWQFAMSETFENALSYKQMRSLRPPVPCNLPSTALFSGFRSSWDLWNPLSKTLLSKCSIIWNIGPGNIWNDHYSQR